MSLTESTVAAGGRAVSTRVTVCDDRQAWNDFVGKSESALFHRWEWDDVFAVYGLAVTRLAAVRDGEIVGVLPLVEQRSRLFGHQLVSLPWFDAAGILTEEESARRLLLESARELCTSRSADLVQFRQDNDCELSPHCRTDKLLMRLSLPQDPTELWEGLKAKVRNQVRKAEKSGLEVVLGGKELLPLFFQVYAHNMRDLGSPSHSLRFFEAIVATFPQEVQICVVRHGASAVGGGFTLANGTCLEIPWASSLRTHNHLCVNHAMYWKILERACQDRFSWFHFGRSSVDSGTYRFKKQWGAEELPLYWYFLGKTEAVEDAVGDPADRFGLAQELWRRLPVSVSSRLGPRLIARLA